MRDEIARADIAIIRSELVALATSYAGGARSTLRYPATILREQLVCLLDEASEYLAVEIGYLADRCETLIVAVLD
jgi:hypothetical protein